MSSKLDRRTFCGLGVLASVPLPAPAPAFEVRELRLDAGGTERRAKIWWPRGADRRERLAGLLLFHGLGETTNATAGTNAWAERYGLLEAHARLTHPPVVPLGARGDLTLERARAINGALAERPFDGGIVYICPYTPNIWRAPNPTVALESLGRWTVETLLPEVSRQVPALSLAHTSIDGCSLGGFVALEVFLRHPGAFRAWGGVQAALREASAPRWAARLEEALGRAGPRPLRLGSSRGDPFLRANVALARELGRRGMAHELSVAPGPHDQPWLRNVGALEMLLWHDRLPDTGESPAASINSRD